MVVPVDSFIRNWFHLIFIIIYCDTKFLVYGFNWCHIIKYLFLFFVDKHNS